MSSGELIELSADNKYLFNDFLFDKLSAGTFSKINFDNIAFVAVASSGAMGWSGACQFFTKEGNKIEKYAVAPESMNISKNLENFLKTLHKPVWRSYYLGAGNRLYMKSEYYERFLAEIERLNLSNRGKVYQKWCQIAYDLLAK